CLYDNTGLLAIMSAPAGGDCGGKPCWTDKPTGYVYKNKAMTPHGIAQLQLSAGVDGKAKIQVKGKGSHLPMPPLASLVSPLTVQLRDAGGACWSAIYTFPPATKNDAAQFKDKAD